MIRVLAVAGLLASSSVLAADAATPLDKTTSVEMGDLAATQVALYFASGAIKEVFDAPVLAQYDRKSKQLVFMILGGRSTVEGARETLDNFVAAIAPVKALLAKQHGIQLTDANVTTVYLLRTVTGESVQLKEIVRREGGKFITP